MSTNECPWVNSHGRRTSYKLSDDVCANCGMKGGLHYSSDGISWCYNNTSRAESKDPKYHTSFSYGKQGKLDRNNPNNTFKRKL